ncbi:Ras- protein rsr1 [Saitozyma podzolica]|uniref:Ras-protein rsr1 n=1 Tax=Saitozyma podzolica TaxID=1890683 RepID=A0A427YTT4_9TREE|nr:Ras- protein rsr1 [Saitozyma podzolica]
MRLYHCAVMGSGGVGKSALTVRFINGSYLEWYDLTIEDSYRKQLTVDSLPCLLEILDTAGIDQYLTLNDLFIRESDGFVLCFSLAQRDTLEEIVRLRETIYRNKMPPADHNVPMVLVGSERE